MNQNLACCPIFFNPVYNRPCYLATPRALNCFSQVDLRDVPALEKVFETSEKFDAVIHFAGLKAVGESVSIPLLYYANNVVGSVNLFQAMEKYGCTNLVFSSSATVYGNLKTVPAKEDFPLDATNPYGRSKLQIEEILRSVSKVPLPLPHA